MTGFVRDPDVWRTIIPKLRDPNVSDDEVIALLHDADRQLDSTFQLLTDVYTPVVGQRNAAVFDSPVTPVTTSGTYVRGLRVGSWIQLNVGVTTSSSLTFGANAGPIVMTLPRLFPIQQGVLGIIGSLTWRDNGTGIYQEGTAFATTVSGYSVGTSEFGVAANRDGSATRVGEGVNLESGDFVGMSVQYLTTRDSL